MNADAVKFELGDTVEFAVGDEKVGIVTGILFRSSGVLYMVTWAEDLNEVPHFDIELKALGVSA